jgi:hypothetical protein
MVTPNTWVERVVAVPDEPVEARATVAPGESLGWELRTYKREGDD